MATVQCAQCGFVSPLASELCAHCGSELPRSAEPATYKEDYSPRYTTELPPPPVGSEGSVLRGLTQPIEPHASIGNTIKITVSLFVKNAWLITKLVFVVFAPFEIFKAVSFGEVNQNWQLAVGGLFLMVVCNALIAPSLIFALMTQLRTGSAPTLTEAYRWGLSRIPKLALTALLVWLITGFGFLLCIIPGIILTLAFSLAYPMASLENGSPIEILKRSYNLTEGYRWNIFVIMLVIGLITGITSIPASIIPGVLSLHGIQIWPLDAALAVVVDIVGEMTTVASLVLYISILSSHPSEQPLEN